VRGGSWYDRPKRCRSSFRIAYPAWRRVFNAGFRIVLEQDDADNTKLIAKTHRADIDKRARE
jgi:hypothetical protein